MLQGLTEIINSIYAIFGIDFGVLYRWLPSDIASTITTMITIVTALAIITMLLKLIQSVLHLIKVF